MLKALVRFGIQVCLFRARIVVAVGVALLAQDTAVKLQTVMDGLADGVSHDASLIRLLTLVNG
jgi:hypothetical protein